MFHHNTNLKGDRKMDNKLQGTKSGADDAGLFQWKAPLSFGKVVPMGMQHVVAAVVSTVGPALMVSKNCGLDEATTTLLVQMALLMTAFSTLLMLFPITKYIGSGLPVIMGVGFTIPTLMSKTFSLPEILGAQLVAGLVAIVFGLCIKPIRKLFPPLVTGTVILAVGVNLYPVAIKYMAGGAGTPEFSSPKNWLVALVTFALVIGLQNFGKGLLKLGAVLWGLIGGYLLALCLGMVDFGGVGTAGWFAVAKPVSSFGISFDVSAIVAMSILFIANSLQTIGDLSSTTMGGMNRMPSDDELRGGIISQGITSIVGGLFGGLCTCSYSQNVGIVTTNRVINRKVFTFAAVVLGLAGFVPKFSALLTTIPNPVLGGATISVFSIIAMTGVNMIISAGPFTMRSRTIVGLAAALGIGVTLVPGCLAMFPGWVQNVFGSFAPVGAAVVAVLLNLILPKDAPAAK